jgi:membrane-associated protein
MFDYLLSIFLVYQYWLFFGVLFVASVGFPLPATALMLVWWALYAEGYFDLLLLFLSGYFGTLLGDITGYSLSYFYGKSIFRRIWLGRIIDSHHFTTMKPYFIRHSVASVILSRCIFTWLWPAINIFAWLTKMKPLHFILADIVGVSLYVTIFLSIGYSFSSEWESIIEVLESFSTMIVTLGVLSALLYFLWKQQGIGQVEESVEGK